MLCVMVVRDHVVACVHDRHGSPLFYSLFCSLKTVVGASVHRAASTSPYESEKSLANKQHAKYHRLLVVDLMIYGLYGRPVTELSFLSTLLLSSAHRAIHRSARSCMPALCSLSLFRYVFV